MNKIEKIAKKIKYKEKYHYVCYGGSSCCKLVDIYSKNPNSSASSFKDSLPFSEIN